MSGGEGDGLRRRRALRQNCPKAGVHQHLGGHESEIARQESAVVADNERIAIDFLRRLQAARSDGDRFAYAADIIERERVGDDRTPSVRTERDVGHAFSLSRTSVYPARSAGSPTKTVMPSFAPLRNGINSTVY